MLSSSYLFKFRLGICTNHIVQQVCCAFSQCALWKKISDEFYRHIGDMNWIMLCKVKNQNTWFTNGWYCSKDWKNVIKTIIWAKAPLQIFLGKYLFTLRFLSTIFESKYPFFINSILINYMWTEVNNSVRIIQN